MAPETSQFESSEMLGAFLASSPLLEDSWRLCSHANANAHAHRTFAVRAAGPITYVAFSAVQPAVRSIPEMVELDENVFGSFSRRLVLLDAALLHLFLSFYAGFHFRQKMEEVMKQSKSIVFCGHSAGGAVASLASLWLLSYIRRAPPPHPISVFCITYGSPLLGNQAFSHAILQERWAANFCHVVAPHDVVPRLLLSDGERWPFGSYLFCTDRGALCLDNASAIVKFLCFTMAEYSSRSDDDHHLMYGSYVSKLCWQYLRRRSVDIQFHHDSNNEAGVALALQTLGISIATTHREAAYEALVTARQMGWRRNLNSARMAVSLAKINPCRAELEWYKKYCDDSDEQLGYYDSFKRRGASRREFRVNMNRLKLAQFWDDLIEKIETNQLTHDFHKLPKYVNASHFYNLLVEPLEIAEYYRTEKHRERGHYIEHGRERRFKIFDKWWGERKFGDEESKPRSKYASLTQDSCFWARVEEAICLIKDVEAETDVERRLMMVEKIQKFEQYAGGMVERMEVSVDVLTKNSSYSLFRQQWGEVRAQLHLHLIQQIFN